MEQRYFISHSARDFRRMAWQALTGIWGIAIIAAIVYSIIGGSSTGSIICPMVASVAMSTGCLYFSARSKAP